MKNKLFEKIREYREIVKAEFFSEFDLKLAA